MCGGQPDLVCNCIEQLTEQRLIKLINVTWFAAHLQNISPSISAPASAPQAQRLSFNRGVKFRHNKSMVLRFQIGPIIITKSKETLAFVQFTDATNHGVSTIKSMKNVIPESTL